MAGTVACKRLGGPGCGASGVELTWVSDASGDATGSVAVSGRIAGVEFTPGTGGSVPTDNYDVTLSTDNGIDVLGGQGANLSQTTATHTQLVCTVGALTFPVERAVIGVLDLVVDNAGDTKSGTITVFLANE